MKDIERETAWWFFDYVVKPLTFVLVLFGVKTTLTKSDGTKTTYNAKGERWKWLTDRKES